MPLPANPSRAFIAANPHLYGRAEKQFDAALAKSEPLKKYVEELAQPKLRHRRGKMNPTEASMAARLQADEYEYAFEPITLRWGGTENDAPMRYTPDFVQFTHGKWTLIEVKGAHERSRDIVRFRGCRAEWQHRFNFEYWQLKKGGWTRLE